MTHYCSYFDSSRNETFSTSGCFLVISSSGKILEFSDHLPTLLSIGNQESDLKEKYLWEIFPYFSSLLCKIPCEIPEGKHFLSHQATSLLSVDICRCQTFGDVFFCLIDEIFLYEKPSKIACGTFSVFNDISEPCLVVDFSHKVISYNTPAQQFFLFPVQEVLNSSVELILESVSSKLSSACRLPSTFFDIDATIKGAGHASVNIHCTFFQGIYILMVKRRGVLRKSSSCMEPLPPLYPSSMLYDLFFHDISKSSLVIDSFNRIVLSNRTADFVLNQGNSVIGKCLIEYFPQFLDQKVSFFSSCFLLDAVIGSQTSSFICTLESFSSGYYFFKFSPQNHPPKSSDDANLAELKLASILSSVQDGILSISLDGTIQSFNEYAERVFGYSDHEIIGQNVNILMHTPYREDYDQFIQKYLSSRRNDQGLDYRREIQGIKKDGSIFPMSLKLSEIVSKDFHLFTGIIRDLSESKKMQADGIWEGKQLKAVLDTTVDGIIVMDSNCIIQSINPAAEKMFGYAESVLAKKNIGILMPQHYRMHHDRNVSNYINSGVKKIIGIGREVQGKKNDGTVFPMYLSVSECIFEGNRWFTGICRDITLQKKAEAAVLREKNKLKSILDSTIDGIITLDTMGKILSFNRGAEKIFGYVSNEPIGKEFDYLMAPENSFKFCSIVRKRVESACTDDIPGTKEAVAITKDSTTFPVDISLSEVLTEDTRIFTAIVRDISNLRVSLMLRSF